MNELAIHEASREGDLCRVRQLIEAGVPVDRLDEEGRTPLHLAARRGRYEVAALLVNSKCDLDIKDSRGRTPVMLAAKTERKDIVELLLHRGAQVNCVDDDGWTLLHHASYFGFPGIVRLIVDHGEADLNAADLEGRTPLMWAAEREKEEEVTAVLIQAGADVNRRDNEKCTALHRAALYGHTRVIRLLLEKEGLDLSPQDVGGDTPLHLACQGLWSCFLRAIKLLLDAGADTNMKDNRGETALSKGIRRGKLTHKEIRFFVQKGAFLDDCDYECISRDPLLKENVLKDVELCTQSVVNKFNRQSLPALSGIARFARRLPNVDNFELGARQIDEVENLVKCEIERNTFCNVVKVRPVALSALCVLSLITCHSGKKRAASAGFGHSPFKKNRN